MSASQAGLGIWNRAHTQSLHTVTNNHKAITIIERLYSETPQVLSGACIYTPGIIKDTSKKDNQHTAWLLPSFYIDTLQTEDIPLEM